MQLPKFLSRRKTNQVILQKDKAIQRKDHEIQTFKSFIRNNSDYFGNQGGIFRNQYGTINASEATLLYNRVAPFSTSVSKITIENQQIKPLIFKDGDGFIKDHPILDLLHNPDGDLTYNEFIERLSSYYLISGQVYIVALGDLSRPPVGLQIIDPRDVSLIESTRNSIPESINLINSNGNQIEFKHLLKDGRDRFVDESGAREIWSIRTFNPDSKNIGTPIIQGVLDEIKQYIESSVHNLSLLERGGRPYLFYKFNEMFSNSEAQLEKQLREFVEGSKNAGSTLIAPQGLDVEESKVNNRDMDFATLKTNVTEAIYNKFNIPLPLVMPSKQTKDNVQQSRMILYDSVVLPLLNRIFAELTNFLVPRFTKDKIIIFYDIREITALRGRALDEQTKIHDLNATTINETRNALGLDDVDNGEVVIVPSNLVPIGSEPSNNVAKRADPDRQNMILKSQKDGKGNRLWSDEEVVELVNND